MAGDLRESPRHLTGPLAAVGLAALMVLAGACGGGDDDGGSALPPGSTTTVADATTATTSAPTTTAAEVPRTPAERGARLTEARGCTACHSVDGRPLTGPTWKGLAGSTVTLKSGQKITATDAYLHRSISDPDVEIADGFPSGVMPGGLSGPKLTPAEIDDIVAYLKTL